MSTKEVLDFLNISLWHAAGYKGQGVRVLMIDDGWEGRPWFHGKVHIVHSNGPSGSQHGIKTAETLHIVAPEAEIYCHEVSYPAYPTPDIVLRYILENEIHIVSMSMGGAIFRNKEYQPLLAEAAKKAIFFTSAGNNPKYMDGAATDDEHWIAVGAAYLLKGKPLRESYSATGKSLDVMGLTGIEVHSSDGQRLFAPEGTSFSCPVVAGMMAIYYSWFYEQYGRYPTPDEAKAFLFSNCIDMEAEGRDDRTGHGLFILPAEIPEKEGEKVRVCIDPGHGGKDPGAVGPGGVKETYVALAVAMKVADLLRKAGVEVKLTRTSDIYVDLQSRCDIANCFKADIFVSIHCNSAGNMQARGLETYCYALGGNGEKLARVIQEEVRKATGFIDRGVKTANFYVLKYTQMPAVLVELGFISNPEEEKILACTDFQTKAAEAIAKGICRYFGIQCKTDYEGHWAEAAIEKVKAAGLMSGYPDGKFKPDQPVTRAELAAVLARILDKLGVKA